ncbi:DUF4422 domain-containing protein [Geofilum rhodophaeum]|uniref:DUF4422 domain-containing protein n=1 Tax=Geofilum rhodophaeum TaxID=1965019 RepID=UPI000B51E794|nr:DUF4422 domain-containing protein [Geofilum rhodophaeum]
MNIRVLIATHKKIKLPNNSVYLPVHVGRNGARDIGYIGDDTGDNISNKNSLYSELTGIYWAWKNLSCDFVGLVHYRRLFAKKKGLFRQKHVLTPEEVFALCSRYDVIVPVKRRYYIETLMSHYANTHDFSHIELTREVIASQTPDYLPFFDNCVRGRSAHMFNMFIMRQDLFHNYCNWLFPILFEIEKNIDYSHMTAFDARLLGRISELLFDVWLTRNNLPYKEVSFVESGVRYLPKIRNFLAAKFLKKKYRQSV